MIRLQTIYALSVHDLDDLDDISVDGLPVVDLYDLSVHDLYQV